MVFISRTEDYVATRIKKFVFFQKAILKIQCNALKII